VHNNARVKADGDGPAVRRFFTENSELGHVDEQGDIRLREQCPLDLVETCKRFFDRFFQAI
jgi:hypothetical protein